jgi:hypothetical protein
MTTETAYVHPDHHRAAIRAAHENTLHQAELWLGFGEAFISTTDELVVRGAGAGSRELREPLRQLIDLADRLRSQPPQPAGAETEPEATNQ